MLAFTKWLSKKNLHSVFKMAKLNTFYRLESFGYLANRESWLFTFL